MLYTEHYLLYMKHNLLYMEHNLNEMCHFAKIMNKSQIIVYVIIGFPM